jgi:hypothetical protein
MEKMSGVIPGRLPELAQVLKKWVYVNEEYTRRCNGNDAPWWYSERSSMSALAAAAWLAKGISIEEYTTTKTRLPIKGKEDKSDRCRCDLYISVRNGKKEDANYVIEAKVCWPNLGGTAIVNKLRDGLEDARQDVRRTHNGSEERRLGVLVASPRLIASRKTELQDRIEEFIQHVQSFSPAAAVAWTFPSEAKDLWSSRTKDYYPGVAILLKPLRRKS